MKFSSLRRPIREAALLGLAAAALLCAGSASAQTQPLAFQVTNNTFSGGDPLFPVTDDLTFNNLLLTETFTDGATTTLTLRDLSSLTPVPTTTLDSGPTDLTSDGFSFVDSAGGSLASATLTGTLGVSGFPATSILPVDVEYGIVDPSAPHFPNTYLNAAFSSTLSFPMTPGQPVPGGIGIGQFSLVANNPGANYPAIFVGTITASTNPVPEASTAVSIGLMLALGLGGLFTTRRRRAAAK